MLGAVCKRVAVGVLVNGDVLFLSLHMSVKFSGSLFPSYKDFLRWWRNAQHKNRRCSGTDTLSKLGRFMTSLGIDHKELTPLNDRVFR